MYKPSPVLKFCVSTHLKKKCFYSNAVDMTCPICSDVMRTHREFMLLSCGHIICNDCLHQGGVNLKTCPLCRS